MLWRLLDWLARYFSIHKTLSWQPAPRDLGPGGSILRYAGDHSNDRSRHDNAAAVNVSLQANNDITVTNDIAMANAGVGITMQAGRDINVNANVSTNNGSIVMVANDSGATAANRSTGVGNITMAAGTAEFRYRQYHLSVGSITTSPFSSGRVSRRRNSHNGWLETSH